MLFSDDNEKLLDAYGKISKDTFNKLYEDMKATGVNGELVIVIGIKDGEIYGCTTAVENPGTFTGEGHGNVLVNNHEFINAIRRIKAESLVR